MRKFFLALLLASTLAACGLKGPLYIPEPKPAAAPAPAAAAPNPQAEEKQNPGAK